MKDVADDKEKAVMQACGHDMHITCLLAAAEKLAGIKSAWKGTLIVLFQPNEERAAGADAMVADGLYTSNKVPTPDYVFGQVRLISDFVPLSFRWNDARLNN